MIEPTPGGITIPVAGGGGFLRTGDHQGKRRFLFACWPFVGHIRPFLSVATALKSRGHDVAFYTDSSVDTIVEAEGFPIFPFERVRKDCWNRVHAGESRVGGGKQSLMVGLRAFQDWLVGTIPEQVTDLEAILEQWQPDVVVTETAMWGPILVLWERQQRPVAILSTLLGCLVPGRDTPPAGLPPPRTPGARLLSGTASLAMDLLAIPLRRRVDRIRARYGLPPLGCSVNAFTGRLPLYLIGNVPELDYNRQDLPQSVHYVGPCLWERPVGDRSAWLDELPTDRPWVHVTEGTSHYQDPFLLRSAVQGLGGLPVEAILTTGPERDPSTLDLGPRTANIRVARWANHHELLPRCSALVTTGGAGTVMATLRAGVPLVVVPTTWDKPDNAWRVVEAGVGVRLTPRACTPDGLRAAVERVLAEPHFRANARRLAERLAAAPGPGGAAELLATLAESRVPAG